MMVCLYKGLVRAALEYSVAISGIISHIKERTMLWRLQQRAARVILAFQSLHESSLPMAHPGYQVLSDILFRLGLIANAHSAVLRQCSSQTVEP